MSSGTTSKSFFEGANQLSARYSVIYVSHSYVNDGASIVLSSWVNDGGILVSTVSGGLRNQANKSNDALSSLFGFSNSPSIYTGTRSGVDARVDFIKQDLAFAEILDTAVTPTGNLTIVGEKAIFSEPTNATTLAKFSSDRSTAAFSRVVGHGQVFYFGFHVGLAYFFSAIPKRPVSRGSTDDTFNHWVPTEFEVAARTLAALPTAKIVGAAPVLSSEPRVDIGVLSAAKKGTVIPVTNWAGKSVSIILTLQFQCDFRTATLASGGVVFTSKKNGWDTFSFTLDIADALILR